MLKGRPALVWIAVWGDTSDFSSPRMHTRNDHGTGCALATAIASGLAEGIDLPKAASKGREFVQDALRRSIHLWNGSGRGSMDLLSTCTSPDRFA